MALNGLTQLVTCQDLYIFKYDKKKYINLGAIKAVIYYTY